MGHYNLEVKGYWIQSDSAAKADFRKTLMLLDIFNLEEYLKLIIVSDQWFSLDKKSTDNQDQRATTQIEGDSIKMDSTEAKLPVTREIVNTLCDQHIKSGVIPR